MTDIPKIIQEYVRSKNASDAMAERANELKQVLIRTLRTYGEEDNKGNLWHSAGNYLLQYQRRQKSPTFNAAKAEQWAREAGLWDDLKKVKVVEELPEDDLVAYVFEHPEYEHVLREVYDVPEPTWAFLTPQEVEQYGDE